MQPDKWRYKITFRRSGVRYGPEYTESLSSARSRVWRRLSARWLPATSAKIERSPLYKWQRGGWIACDPPEEYTCSQPPM